MTTSVSAPSILLLGGSSATAAAGDTNATQPSGNAGSGDFDLLLSALTDQHVLMLKTPIAIQSTDEPAASESPDSGSALPIGGIFLPLMTAPGAAEKNALVKTEGAADQNKNSSSDKADDQNDSAITLLLNPAMPIIPPAPTSTPSAPVTTTADDLVAELAALTSGGGKSAKADKTAAVSSRAETGTTNVDATSNTSPSTDTKNIMAVAGIPDTARSDETDFGALLKQIDNAAPTSTNNSAAIAQWQDPRSLANTNASANVNPNASTAAATVAVPVGANGWSDAVTDKVMWFSANHINSAEIHLNPSDLGPVQVRISTQNDQTTVAFSSPHAAVREALDHALPRLRDMMGSQGIQLLDVSVGGQSAERQQYSRGNENFNNGAPPSYFADDNKTTEPIAVTAVNAARLSRSAVDAYV